MGNINIYGNISEYEVKPLDDMMYTIFRANCQTCLEKPWMSVLCSEVHYKNQWNWAQNDSQISCFRTWLELVPEFNGRSSGSNTWRYVFVPYFWPYELWGYSLKFRPFSIGLIYGIGTSNQSVPATEWNHHDKPTTRAQLQWKLAIGSRPRTQLPNRESVAVPA